MAESGLQPELVEALNPKTALHSNQSTSHANLEQQIRASIAKANKNVLRLALYQVTQDPELAQMQVDNGEEPIAGGYAFTYNLAQSEHEKLDKKAYDYLYKRLSTRDKTLPPLPSKDTCRQQMEIFLGEKVKDDEFDYHYEELAYEDFPRNVEWTKRPSPDKLKQFSVVIVGAGIGGIAMAIQLKRLGIQYTQIERQSDFAGTWNRQRYPGAAVDTPSFLYQFTFVRDFKFKHWFSGQAETKEYLTHVVQSYGIKDSFQFNTSVEAATWDEAESKWNISLKAKDGQMSTIKANAIISATGLFSVPNRPVIQGMQDYKGRTFHTSEWDTEYDLKGKKVAIIGNGSTGVQTAPLIAEQAAQLTIYQRTPQWMLNIPTYTHEVDSDIQWLFDNVPFYTNWFSFDAHITAQQLQYGHAYDREWQKNGGEVSKHNDAASASLRKYLADKFSDHPDLLQKLTPSYRPLVRRLVIDGHGWYDCLLKDHVELVTEGIERFTEKGILSKDGKNREHDLIIQAFGYQVDQYFFPTIYTGRKGATFEKLWAVDGPRSFLGLHYPDMPNFYSIYSGGHQPRGGSYYSWAEIWSRYIAKSLVYLLEQDKKSVAVSQDVFDGYQTRFDEAMKTCIWETIGGAAYYVNKKHGRSTVNMSWPTFQYHQMVKDIDPSDFIFT